MAVPMLRNSGAILQGDMILVMDTANGSIGVALPDIPTVPDLTAIRYVRTIPIAGGRTYSLPAVTSTLLSWYMEAYPSGDLTVNVLVNGSSITGGSPPSIVGGTSNAGDVSGWSPELTDTDVISFGLIGFDVVTEFDIWLYAVRAVPV